MSIIDTNSSNRFDELSVTEAINHETAQIVLSVTTTPVKAQVGIDKLQDRKCVMMQPRVNGIFWGFSESLQPFRLFKDQFVILPVGNQDIWLATESSSGDIAIAEGI